MAIGIFLLIVGLPLAVAPLASARAAGRLRYVPYRDSSDTIRFYRATGVVVAVVGIALVGLAL